MAKILVVEDEQQIVRVVRAYLERAGHLVVTAGDGQTALHQFRVERPDLIVLDIILPKKNGFQVCRQLKTAPDTEDIKILMLTSKTQDSDRFWGLEQGADEYMTKPFDDDQYLAIIAKLL